VDALIMAGGQGTRLRPLTFSLPKPLLPVGERPIIEIILRQLRQRGFNRVFVAVGFKGHLIRAYLAEVKIDGLEIRYITEDEPLGTAGALHLLPDDVDHVFMINGDILTAVDFGLVLREHIDAAEQCLTVVVHQHDVPLPYGVFRLDGVAVIGVDEKPTLHMPVATGMYALDRRAIAALRPGHSDMPELINDLASRGAVRAHLIDEFWTDVADLADYERVNLDAERWSQF
jgi:NDP-sugar pyrophosphorylase family protein